MSVASSLSSIAEKLTSVLSKINTKLVDSSNALNKNLYVSSISTGCNV